MLPVALAPLLIMAIQGYHCARQAIVASQEAHLQSVLDSRKTRIESWLGQVRADFRFLEASPCIQGLCGSTPSSADPVCCEQACNLLEDLREGLPSYRFLGTYDPHWRLLVSTGELDPFVPASAEGQNPMGDGELVAGSAEGRFVPLLLREETARSSGLVLAPPRLAGEDRLVLDVAQRMEHPESGRPAYIVAGLDLSTSIDPILQDRTGLGETGDAYLIAPAGRYPALNGLERRVSGADSYRFLDDAGGAVQRYVNPLGVRVMGLSAVLPELEGRLVVEITEREAFAWLGILRNRAILTGLLTLLLVLLVAWRGARLLAQPLRELASVAQRIAGGKQDERVGPLKGAEAEDVRLAFNRMIDQLEASHQRLRRAASLAAVGELSASIVHEMRNPLSSIKMNLQALRRRVEGDRTHAELAEIASEQVVRLERMLTELLGYGKPLQLRPVEIRFADIAREVIDLTRTQAAEAEVTVSADDRTAGESFLADAEQLRRALTNLVLNAVQASPGKGRVVLGAEIPSETTDQMRLFVTDEGRGIGDGETDQLFQPFFTTRDEGTGLGLSNVRKIAECHGGRAFARNRSAGGALFGIDLPRKGTVG